MTQVRWSTRSSPILGRQMALGHGEADRSWPGPDPGGRWWSRRPAYGRTRGGPRSSIPTGGSSTARSLRRGLVAGQVQQGVDQHRAVARRQDEAVAVGPVRAAGVELQKFREQHRRHVGHAHRHAGVAAVGLLDRRPWPAPGWRRPSASGEAFCGVDGFGVGHGGIFRREAEKGRRAALPRRAGGFYTNSGGCDRWTMPSTAAKDRIDRPWPLLERRLLDLKAARPAPRRCPTTTCSRRAPSSRRPTARASPSWRPPVATPSDVLADAAEAMRDSLAERRPA